MANIKRMLTSCFGLGRLPLAPGTWGSLPPVIIFGLLCYFGASSAMITNIMAALVLAGSVVCVQFAPAAMAATGKNDPSEVVADEFAGQAVPFVFSPFLVMETATVTQIFITAFIGFVLFRIFDITKPWPIRKLEKYPWKNIRPAGGFSPTTYWQACLHGLFCRFLSGLLLLFRKPGCRKNIQLMFAGSSKPDLTLPNCIGRCESAGMMPALN